MITKNEKLGERIRIARKQKGMTQEDLAEKVYVSKQAVSNWETGKNRPDEDTREILVKLLEISFEIDKSEGEKLGMNLIKLKDINTIPVMENVVDQLCSKIEVDVYEKAVKKLVKLALFTVIGYNNYYCERVYSDEEKSEIDWGSVIYYIQEIAVGNQILDSSRAAHEYNSNVKNQINVLHDQMFGELMEDFEESDNLKRELGHYALDAGHDLIGLLPEQDNDIMTEFKIALMQLVDILDEIE